MNLQNDINWKIRKPNGYDYSGYTLKTKAEAIKRANLFKKWSLERKGFRHRSKEVKILKTPGGYAIYVGKIEGQLKINGKWK